ncbi:MAG: SAM-dependent methyltransferase [Patescibacteria group bacterium]|nr:SAM-dependent methyltransferase [Patescibacteria group bacterium]
MKEKLKGKIEKPLRVFVQERNHLTFALVKINFFIHDIPISEIRMGNTLLNPAFIDNNKLKQFDVAVTNPM